MHETTIRKASPSDAQVASKLIYSTGSYFFDYIFFNNKENILKLLEYLFTKNLNIFSYKFATMARHNNSIVGIELGYSKLEKEIHALFNSIYIILRDNFFKLPRILIRDYVLHRFLKPIESDTYYIAHLAVLSSHQHEGVGTNLIENAFRNTIKRGLSFCSLDVSIKNIEALKLYENMGFEIRKEIRYPIIEKKFGLDGQYRMIKKIK